MSTCIPASGPSAWRRAASHSVLFLVESGRWWTKSSRRCFPNASTSPVPISSASAALYEELLDPGPEEPGTSVESDVVIPMIIRLDGRELRLFSTITTFGTPMDITLDEIAIESYYPADPETDAYFTDPATTPVERRNHLG
ncbi:hypothetical protein [Actinomadura sp. B10D3]|uniref:hypothetical protein n=1 Tax=Actinomadura sp. B10D3 TaxID=3153557 RepID=UPI00325F8358